MTAPALQPSSTEPLLAIRDLSVSFATDGGVLRAVDGVSFEIGAGRTVALVGESGCGKSVTAHAILRLVPAPAGRIDAGKVLFEGRDLLTLPERDLREVRGARIGMIFQEPMTSLNPVYTVGTQIAEAVRLHADVSRAEARRRAVGALQRVGFPTPELGVDRYPHELSGGMRQRVMIAMALVNSPALLIADEPTTALDSTTQAQILELFATLKDELGMALLLIAHDLALVAEIADEVVVLYAGQVVERGEAAAILREPRHPYTRALLRSVPPIGARRPRGRATRRPRLPTIEGTLPDLRQPQLACRFGPRCPEAFARCAAEAPPPYPIGSALVRCHLHDPNAPISVPAPAPVSAPAPAPVSAPVSQRARTLQLASDSDPEPIATRTLELASDSDSEPAPEAAVEPAPAAPHAARPDDEETPS
jgi:oligopeptide/dipeptide ABC transporter ATP-binding protein